MAWATWAAPAAKRPRSSARNGAQPLRSGSRHPLADNPRVSVDHYENFPVASVLCPPRLRPAVVAIYHFARTADDLADEGQAPADARLADLAAYRADLVAVMSGRQASARWSPVFQPLACRVQEFSLPAEPLHALLDAFEQDVRNPDYPDRAALLDYCRRSANPVGRLLLHLYRVQDAPALLRSDAICTALQLINFWQDLSVDGPRGRHYVPLADASAHGVTREELSACADSPRARALVADLTRWAVDLMQQGAPLALQLPGRAGWELRLVVQGGLRIAARIRAMDHASLSRRPRLTLRDFPALGWGALAMGWRRP
jgi:squalene synthase HpnC